MKPKLRTYAISPNIKEKNYPERQLFVKALAFYQTSKDHNYGPIKAKYVCEECGASYTGVTYFLNVGSTNYRWSPLLLHNVKLHNSIPPEKFAKEIIDYYERSFPEYEEAPVEEEAPVPNQIIEIDTNDLGVRNFPNKEKFLETLSVIQSRLAETSPLGEKTSCEFCSYSVRSLKNKWTFKGVEYVWDHMLLHAVKAHNIKPPNKFISAVLQSVSIRDYLQKYGKRIKGNITISDMMLIVLEDWYNLRKDDGLPAEIIRNDLKNRITVYFDLSDD